MHRAARLRPCPAGLLFGRLRSRLRRLRQGITSAGEARALGAVPQAFATGPGRIEQFRQHAPAQLEHGLGHPADFPLGPGAAAMFEKIEQGPAVHGYHNVGGRRLGQHEAGVLFGRGAPPVLFQQGFDVPVGRAHLVHEAFETFAGPGIGGHGRGST